MARYKINTFKERLCPKWQPKYRKLIVPCQYYSPFYFKIHSVLITHSLYWSGMFIGFVYSYFGREGFFSFAKHLGKDFHPELTVPHDQNQTQSFANRSENAFRSWQPPLALYGKMTLFKLSACITSLTAVSAPQILQPCNNRWFHFITRP